MAKTKTHLRTEIELLVFRINGSCSGPGIRKFEHLGLTSARWQMLGAVALSPAPSTAPQIGEAMGVTRQGGAEAAQPAGRLPQSTPRPFAATRPDRSRQGRVCRDRSDAAALGQVELAEGLPHGALEAALRVLQPLSAILLP